MPHPIMFDDDDPGLAKLRAIALAYPGAYEKVSHGRPAFFVSEMFAMYGGSSKEVRVLVDASYRLVAPKKSTQDLDQR